MKGDDRIESGILEEKGQIFGEGEKDQSNRT